MTNRPAKRRFAIGLSAFMLLSMACRVPDVQAAPGDVLFTDNFNRASLAPWATTDSTRAGILTGAQVSQSSPNGAYTRNDVVTVTSPAFFAAVPAARLDIWIRRGADAFSEDTDDGEDLYLEYQRSDGSWGLLQNYLGSGTNGQIYTESFILPSDALHGTLAIRLRQTAGSGFDWDYWHFDDIRVEEIGSAPPLVVGACDDFENGMSNWVVTSQGGGAGISDATSSSPTQSLYLNGGVVEARSSVIDTSSSLFGDLTVWVRRGSDAFSEDPDGGENLVVEYLDDLGSWTTLETFTGAGGQGQIFARTYNLPAGGRHAGFQLRFQMTAGSGSIWDFWHIDDVCLEERIIPVLSVSKVAQTLTDPVNGSTNPKAIPGATVQYTVGVSNLGPGPVDSDSLVITDPLPANTAVFVDTSSGDPIRFIDGAVASGLAFNYPSDVTFSNQPGGGPPYNYVPVPDAQGFDPAVTGFRINPTGVMSAAGGGGDPSFGVLILVRVD